MAGIASFAGTLALAGLVGCFPREPWVPWDGLRVGTVLDLRLVDVYEPSGPYLWWGAGETRSSCDAIDGLRAGVTVRLQVIGSRASFDVADFIARPLSGVTGIDFSGVLREVAGATIGAEVGAAGGSWRLLVHRHPSLDTSPLGEAATPGAFPPLRVLRFLSRDVQCGDVWVGELHEVADVPDGGPDA